MAEPHAYGMDVVQPIRAFAGPNDPVAIHSLVSARLYPNAPSNAQKTDVAGVLGGFVGAPVTTFSDVDPVGLTSTVTFPAVDDPSPLSSALYDFWHVVANIRLQDLAQPQVIYREIIIWRITGQFSQLTAALSDVYAVESDIQRRLGDIKTGAKLELAQAEVFEKLRDKELDRSRIKESDLRMILVWLTAAYCLRDMSTNENNYWEKAEFYTDRVNSRWSSLKIGYADGDNSAIGPEDNASLIRTMWVRI